MSILGGVRWYEWLFLFVLVVGGSGTYWLIKDYRSTVADNAGLQLENALRGDVAKHEAAANAVTNTKVAEYVENRDATRQHNDQSRSEVVNEYLDTRPTTEPFAPAAPRVPIPVAPIPLPAPITDSPAFRQLLVSLREETCRARSGNQDAGCAGPVPASAGHQ